MFESKSKRLVGDMMASSNSLKDSADPSCMHSIAALEVNILVRKEPWKHLTCYATAQILSAEKT